jgi:glycosyltransferase involved in cell wall biosynthesis
VKLIFLSENSLASRTVQEGIKVASGEYCVILDHDDELLPDALLEANNLLNECRHEIVGLIGRCLNENNVLIGSKINKKNGQILNEGDLRFRKDLTSELVHFVRPDKLLKMYEGFKKGFANGYVWSRGSFLNYKFLCVDIPFRKYHTEILNSASKSNKFNHLYPEFALCQLLILKNYTPFLLYKPLFALLFFSNYFKYTRGFRGRGLKDLQQVLGFRFLIVYILIRPILFLKYIFNNSGYSMKVFTVLDK